MNTCAFIIPNKSTMHITNCYFLVQQINKYVLNYFDLIFLIKKIIIFINSVVQAIVLAASVIYLK